MEVNNENILGGAHLNTLTFDKIWIIWTGSLKLI
jgi:hypothetical protein